MPTNDPHSYADLSQAQIAHIDFDLHVDFEKSVIEGRADYALKGPASGSLSLDTRGLDIGRVMRGGRELAWSLGGPDEIKGRRLQIEGLEGGESFSIEWRTAPDAAALQWLAPPQTLGGEHPFLYSQCQAIAARSVFPCQDTPSVRFTYRASIGVPEPLTAVMAAEAVGVERGDGVATFRFNMPQPIPSYLFALAAGDLAFQALGPRTGVYAEPEQLEAAAYEFAENEARLAEAEKLFGPYRWDRYDLLIMPPSFPYGGMENPRLTFLTPMGIRGDRMHTDVVSHELAHAWTGNLVTNATWEHFWLNEGWTTYAERRISEVLYGVDHVQLLNAVDRERMFDMMERLNDPPLTCLRTHLEGVSPDRALTVIPYAKGSTFLALVEAAVGRPAFDRFIQKYIDTFAFQSLTTEDFLAFLRQELPAAFERVDVDVWITQPGFPDSAPPIRSRLLEEVKAAAQAYRQGERPSKEAVEGWNWLQRMIFIRSLPETIPVEACRELERLFGFDEHTYPEVLGAFYRLCIRSGYQDVRPGIEALMRATGRMLVVTPLFWTMLQTEWSRPLARPLFESVRERYHPAAAAALQRMLAKAGL